ncbi:hypothetical protein ACQR1Y_21055 [Bradyrhizobium sp. HKCCYLRH3099]|uniref:hypothetical protein n=1 Tax=unclassified Bradyrhizobium TaxID=2631580 RepID=UPI003EB74AFB
MKQRDSNSAPDRAALDQEARALRSHPDFDRAVRAFCQGMIETHAGRRLANIGLGHTLGWAVAVLIVYLDHVSPEGTTSSQLIELCTNGGLAGPKAVKGAIQTLLSFDLIGQDDHPTDGRATRLRPLPLLLDIQSDNVAARLAALETVQPLPAPAHEWGRQRHVMLAFYGGNVEVFARHRFRLYDGFPEIQAFMDRASGYLLLLELLQNCGPTDGIGVLTAVQPSILAPRVDVSRTHLNKLLAAARDQGWLTLGPRRGEVLLDAGFYQRLQHWIALELVWTWWLVRAA